MSSPEPLALVQPTPFHAAFGIAPMTDDDGQTIQFVMLRIDMLNGSFVQLMQPENALQVASGLRDVAEQAQAAGGLVVPATGLVVPNGHDSTP